LEAGVAILCQPMDVEVTNTNQIVSFEVEATGCNPGFQWYFHNGYTADVALTDKRGYLGANTKNLIIPHPSAKDVGFYYCEIATVDSICFPVRTTTRRAALGFAVRSLLLENIYTPLQALPAPSTTGPQGCLGEPYGSAVTFKNGGAGYPAPGLIYITVILTNPVNQASLPLNLADYQMTAYDLSNSKTSCLTSTAPDNHRCIVGTGDSYLLAVFFNTSAFATVSQWPQVLLNISSSP
jgi:hypothetical protein